jgi:hypothetical protein
LKENRKAQRIDRFKLKEEHISFLTNQKTLMNWASLSLEQRARMLHRKFPEVIVSASTIRNIYSRHGIKFKFIKRGKKIVDFADPHYLHLFKEMYDAVRTTRLKDMKLVWVDEAVFTFNTLGKRAWSSKFQSISVKDIDFKVRTTAIIAAISEDGGLEAITMHKRSVSTPDFVAFIELLS